MRRGRFSASSGPPRKKAKKWAPGGGGDFRIYYNIILASDAKLFYKYFMNILKYLGQKVKVQFKKKLTCIHSPG